MSFKLLAAWRAGMMLALLALVGCQSKGPELVPVSGTVLDPEGNPIRAALVFHPQDETNKRSSPQAVADRQGKFSLTCLKGRYKVTFVPLPKDQPEKENDKDKEDPINMPKGNLPPPEWEPHPFPDYQNSATSPWLVVVPENGKEDVVLSIKQAN